MATATSLCSFGASYPAQTPEVRRRSNPPQQVACTRRYVCEAEARGQEEHIAAETRVAKDLAVPTGEGAIPLRGYV